MKSIYLTDDLEAVKAQTREYVEKEIVPNAGAWEDEGVPRSVLDDMGRLGFFGLRIPEEHGGIGLGSLASVMFAEELGRSTYGGFTITVLVHTDLAVPYVLNFGSPEQKARWLPQFASGEVLTAIAVTEPDAGSDVAAIRTTARREGDGFVINGTKMFITNGSIADLVFVAAKTNPEVKGSRGSVDLCGGKRYRRFHGEPCPEEDGVALLGYRRARIRRRVGGRRQPGR